jgi:hypothetical protein
MQLPIIPQLSSIVTTFGIDISKYLTRVDSEKVKQAALVVMKMNSVDEKEEIVLEEAKEIKPEKSVTKIKSKKSVTFGDRSKET